MSNEKNYILTNEYRLCGNVKILTGSSYVRDGRKGRNSFDETWEESREDEKEAYR